MGTDFAMAHFCGTQKACHWGELSIRCVPYHRAAAATVAPVGLALAAPSDASTII